MAQYAQRKIPFNSDLHAMLIPKLMDRVRRSRDAMIATRQDAWQRCEEQFLAYIPASDNDQLRKAARKNGEPQYTTIEIPYSYAMVLAAHTYLTSVFFSRDPVFQIKGRHGEAQNAEMAMEALLDYQLNVGGHLPPMYVWLLDALKYGLGVIGYYWDDEIIQVRKRQEVAETFLGIPIPGKKKIEEFVDRVPGYSGTRAFNVRPYDFLWDPSYPVGQFQKGEFCGRYVELNWLDLQDGAKDGKYFNLEKVAHNRRVAGANRVAGSAQVTLPNDPAYTSLDAKEFDTAPVVGYELVVRLIPKEWGLGKETYSEKWVFTIADESVIIGAQPLGYYHNRFPFEVAEQEVDGHSLFSRSMLEITKPLNDTLTWLINTHFYNVRKSLNDQLVVDPSKVVMKDVTNPEPGRIIRLKPAAYGSDVRLAVSQLQVQDVTRAHVTDAQMVMEMLQKVTGVNDNLMGAVNSGRRTAAEVRSSTTFGINRMKTMAEYLSATSFAPWTQQIVQTTQQCFDLERQFRIVGDQAQYMTDRFIHVTPDSIAGFFDFVPVDGTLPVDRMAQVNLWNQLMAQAGKMPQIMQSFDLTKIFAFVAQLAGLKNINQFRIQILPDAQMQAQAQAGNSIPMNAPAPAPADMAGVDQNGGNVQPPQVPGLGQQL